MATYVKRTAAYNLSTALLSGEWTPASIEACVRDFLSPGKEEHQTRLLYALQAAHDYPYPPSSDWLIAFFLANEDFAKAAKPLLEAGEIIRIELTPPHFSPAAPFAGLPIPHITTAGGLARWLDISIGELDWFADVKKQHGRRGPPVLKHYWYKFVPRKSGDPRLIEAPKPRLRALQRKVLRDILDHIPPSPSAFGFVRGRSCKAAAQSHAGEDIVACLDLKDFFASVPVGRVHHIFRSLGYPAPVAALLTGLCVTSTPADVFKDVAAGPADWRTVQFYGAPHLPQGAPPSPALANLCAWRLDKRLAGLAGRFGVHYTRYADDLTFSGDRSFGRNIRSYLKRVEHIVADEGFALNVKKTRIMRRHASQRVTGLIVNRHINIKRSAYDELKAVLHNCRNNGPEAENRTGASDFKAHLEGRINWVQSVNLRRGGKLRAIFESIDWD